MNDYPCRRLTYHWSSDYALYRDGEIPLRLFRALQIWLLPRFCLSEPTTQRAIEYWRQILYQDIESTASTDLVHWTEPSMVWRAIRQLLQHAIHQAKDRLCQLVGKICDRLHSCSYTI
jgi:hypothetical protein